jgi:Rad3-related DNA helicase
MGERMNFLEHFPDHLTPRPEQIHVLEQLGAKWETNSVFCITAPTALGKTAISVTIARAMEHHKKQTSLLVPSNILLSQFSDSYPDIKTLWRKDSYEEMEEYTAAVKLAEDAKIRAMNYHMYDIRELYSYCMVADEAHKISGILLDMNTVRVWRSLHKYPDGLHKVVDVLDWMKSLPTNKRTGDILSAEKRILNVQHESVVEHTEELREKKMTQVLKVLPLNMKGLPPRLWPSAVKKIVLLSATIGPKDLEFMGLDYKRAIYIEAASPIPAARRRVLFKPTAYVSNKHMEDIVPRLCAAIKQLAEKHVNDKGLIHIPYALSSALKPHLIGDRYLWHDKENKAEVLRRFKDADTPNIMVSSGMYEGVDLPYDLARWQIVAKVPYLNMGAGFVQAKMQEVNASLSQIKRRYDNIISVIDEFVIAAPQDGMVIYRRNWDGTKVTIGSQISTWDNVVATLPDFSVMMSRTRRPWVAAKSAS